MPSPDIFCQTCFARYIVLWSKTDATALHFVFINVGVLGLSALAMSCFATTLAGSEVLTPPSDPLPAEGGVSWDSPPFVALRMSGIALGAGSGSPSEAAVDEALCRSMPGMPFPLSVATTGCDAD